MTWSLVLSARRVRFRPLLALWACMALRRRFSGVILSSRPLGCTLSCPPLAAMPWDAAGWDSGWQRGWQAAPGWQEGWSKGQGYSWGGKGKSKGGGNTNKGGGFPNSKSFLAS